MRLNNPSLRRLRGDSEGGEQVSSTLPDIGIDVSRSLRFEAYDVTC